jgi:WD40 repeat protein
MPAGPPSFSSDSRLIAVGTEDTGPKPCRPKELIKIIDILDNKAIQTLSLLYEGKPFGMGARVLVFSADGAVLAVGCNSDTSPGGLITLFDVKSAKVMSQFTLDLGGEVMDVCFTPDGSSLIGGVQGPKTKRSLMVWDLSQKKAKHSLQGCKGLVHAIACSPTRDIVAAGCGTLSLDPQLLVWNWKTGKTIATLRGHRTSVLGVAFSQNGRLMASGDFDGEVRIWETASWKEVTWLKPHNYPIDRISFAADGQRMLTIGGGKAKEWELSKLLSSSKRSR